MDLVVCKLHLSVVCMWLKHGAYSTDRHVHVVQDVGAWQKLMVCLLEFMWTDSGEIFSAEFQEDMQDMLEYSNEFSQLSNARLPTPPICPEVWN